MTKRRTKLEKQIALAQTALHMLRVGRPYALNPADRNAMGACITAAITTSKMRKQNRALKQRLAAMEDDISGPPWVRDRG